MIGQVRVKIGDREVVASGSLALADPDQPIEIHLADLEFELKFDTDSAKTAHIRADTVSGKALRLNLFNFSSPLGTFVDAPVGTINNKTLTLSVAVHQIGKGPKLVTYTFSLEGENGQQD